MGWKSSAKQTRAIILSPSLAALRLCGKKEVSRKVLMAPMIVTNEMIKSDHSILKKQ